MVCVLCHGKGCDRCDRRGHTPIESCPKKLIRDSGVWDFIDQAKLVEQIHVLPVAGGTLDQTESFLQALRFLRDEEADLRNRS